jgi:hypothetical protein
MAGLLLTGCRIDLSQGSSAGSGGTGNTYAPTSVTYGPMAHATFGNAGNTVDIGIAVGSPRAASSSPEAQACIAGSVTSTGREVAVPVELAVTLHSASSEQVSVDLGNVEGLADDGSVSLPSVPIRWSVKYSDTPQECKGGSLSDPSVRWNPAAPGVTNSFQAWMVLSDGISADDPTGHHTAGRLLLLPNVTVGDAFGVPAFSPHDAQVVQCGANDPAAGTVPYLAVVPGVAVHYGCTSTTAGDTIAVEHDRICDTAFPGQSSQETAGATVYNRSASLFQVCEGFGADSVSYSTDMTCAIVGLVASEVGRRGEAVSLDSVDRLCDTASVVESLQTGTWAAEAGRAGCQVIGGIFAEGLAIAAAGASAEAGAVVGVAVYHALQVGVALACDGDFRNAVENFGTYLEAHHESNVAHDLVSKANTCLKNDPHALLKHWSTTDCP